ncbi:T-cell surface glycoprotein CD8 alpha chain isoform 2-T3 [Spinachia spinachia]
MDKKWILGILVILVFRQNRTSGAFAEKTVQEGAQVDIECKPAESGTLLIWFRVLPKNLEFTGSFSPSGVPKTIPPSFPATFSHSRISDGILSLKSFQRSTDSGIYSCASLFKGNQLTFGKVTRLVGEKELTDVAAGAPEAPKATISAPHRLRTTDTPCVCNQNGNDKQGATGPQMFCSPIILGPLAGGCGLLLVLLVITSLYCNQMRTRRCPHHYKRKLQAGAPGKQMTSGHV